MTDKDSRKLAEEVAKLVPEFEIRMGPSTAASYVGDTRHIAFVASRYKFVSKMLEGAGDVLEVGCGDGFGAPFVGQAVARLVCTDIDEPLLADNRRRFGAFANMTFEWHDFRVAPYSRSFDGIYLVDVLEHVFPDEEKVFCDNVFASLGEHGVAVVGVPNKAADIHASAMSRKGHVNLKNHAEFRALLKTYFHNVFMFSMNDEVVHTGYSPMAHYLFAVCCAPRKIVNV